MTDQPTSNKGGQRPGAGRPRKRDVHGTAIVQAEKQIRDRLPELIGRMLELANGITVQETDKDGGVNVYTRPPDYKAGAYLIDRIMGKPTERREDSGGATLNITAKELMEMSEEQFTELQRRRGLI